MQLKGDYWILEFPLDQTYNVTESAYRYFQDTKTVTLTENRSSKFVHFYFKKDYDSIEKDQRKDIRFQMNFVFNLKKCYYHFSGIYKNLWYFKI